ncbi:MAG: DUF4364 family protein [Clostridia bacterium]|nr:DUF4364 family protein [Clostridia bacterium]
MSEGYIRSGSDMKFLILYVLDVIGEPISDEILLQAVQSDPLADYFSFASSLRELTDDGFVAGNEKGYAITPEGKRNFDALGRVLPFSVRRDAQNAATRAIAAAKRDALISTSTEKAENGNHFTTRLSLNDGLDEILTLSLLTVSAEQGAELERTFEENAEEIYKEVLAVLLKDRSGESGKDEV